MKDETIAVIVDEVIRRIKLLLNTHRCLILIRENTDYTLLNMLLLSMVENGFIFDAVVQEDHKETIDIDEKIKNISFITKSDLSTKNEFINQYEAVIISNLNIMEISKLSTLNIENHFMCLVYEALKEGISVYGFSKDIEIENNINLKSLVLKYCKALEEIGLKIISKKKDDVISINHQIVTLEQVKDIKQNKLVINKNAIVTNAAKDYLTQNKIEIFRK